MNNSHIVKLLISKGIDTTIKDNTGKTVEQLSYDLVSGHIVIKLAMHDQVHAVWPISSAGKYKLLGCASYCNRLLYLIIKPIIICNGSEQYNGIIL